MEALCREPPCGSNGASDLVASIREILALERSFQCMRLIQEKGNVSSRELADRLNISNGSAYYILNALIAKGYVKVMNLKNNSKKSGYIYLLTRSGMLEKSRLTRQFIEQKKAEYQSLEEEIEALQSEIVESK